MSLSSQIATTVNSCMHRGEDKFKTFLFIVQVSTENPPFQYQILQCVEACMVCTNLHVLWGVLLSSSLCWAAFSYQREQRECWWRVPSCPHVMSPPGVAAGGPSGSQSLLQPGEAGAPQPPLGSVQVAAERQLGILIL